jgi:hypothetical protein
MIKDSAYDLLTNRQKNFVEAYIKFGNVSKASHSVGILPVNGYKMLKSKEVALVIEIEKNGQSLNEMPTLESIMTETVSMHDMDKLELEAIKKKLEEPDIESGELRKRADKLQERMEKRNRFVLDVRAKFGETLNDDTKDIIKMPLDKASGMLDELYSSIKSFLKKKQWFEDEKIKDELREWKCKTLKTQ